MQKNDDQQIKIDWLIDWLIDWMTYWLTDSLIDFSCAENKNISQNYIRNKIYQQVGKFTSTPDERRYYACQAHIK